MESSNYIYFLGSYRAEPGVMDKNHDEVKSAIHESLSEELLLIGSEYEVDKDYFTVSVKDGIITYGIRIRNTKKQWRLPKCKRCR